MWEFWIDRGGTFTDVVARHADGRIVTRKLLSENPGRYEDAALEAIRQVLDLPPGAAVPAAALAAVKMGTTVATNALLERKGAPVLFMTTAGLADLLVIGTQARPRLFDRAVVRPRPLYDRVAEVAGRIDATGAEVAPLEEGAARRAMAAARADGIASIAIALMHACHNPAHEDRLAAIARELGYTTIVTSAGVSRLARILPRAETAVVDAYLTPELRVYADRLEAALPPGRLMFMQSNGGLVGADGFHGRNAILSGPAGGIVGMARTAAAAGFTRVIGFDMGGTSTDVGHYAGAFERTSDATVAGQRIRVPMLAIHTVAAGGGSVCAFRDGRLQVGPDSAGADPGPACYRRGGPLTVTDCNLHLGRLQAAGFPAVFGPGGDQPPDPQAAARRLAEVAAALTAAGQPAMTTEALAAAFISIAVDNMAHAVRAISTDQGRSLDGYALQAFGGAGGQHACDLATALGMDRVLIHPMAGVLSAFGMGLAEVRALREAEFDAPLEEDPGPLAGELTAAAVAEVAAQGAPVAATRVTAHLRYVGAHQPLPVPMADAATMRAAFLEAHRARFGFVMPGRAIRFQMLTAEAEGPHAPLPALPPAATDRPGTTASVWLDGPATVPLLHRSAARQVSGPAVIDDPIGTIWLPPGWQADATPDGMLVMTRGTAAPAATPVAIPPTGSADPLRLALLSNLFVAIADRMGRTLALTAWSVNIKERLDFSCALFDDRGNLVANAPHVPVHLGSMSDAVRSVMHSHPDLTDGDAVMLNSPFRGGTHLPDVTVIAPVFLGGRRAFWLGARGHHADIGGRTPGSSPPDSRRIEDEGVVIDPVRIVADGVFDEGGVTALLSQGPYPARAIAQNLTDLRAQIAALETGRKGLRDAAERHGLETLVAYAGHVQDNAAAILRIALRAVPDGAFALPLDTGQTIRVRVTIDRHNGLATVDFTGTSAQHDGNCNAPLPVTRAVVMYALRVLVGRDVPLNEGFLRPVKLIVPPGSMLNPAPPAAVIAGNTEVSQGACNALMAALGLMAAGQGTMNNFVWGNADFQNYETLGGGTGAGPGFAGADAVHSHMTNTLLTDPEVLEARFPVRLERMAIRTGPPAEGRWPGGRGMDRVLRFLTPVTVTTLCQSRDHAPFGLQGGGPGAAGRNSVIHPDGREEDLPGFASVDLPAGAAFRIRTPGGGGWGAA